MNSFGRIALCGMISSYNETTPSSAPHNLRLAVRKRLTLQGFIVSDHLARQAQFYNDMSVWIAAGKIKWQETIVAGIENAPGPLSGSSRVRMSARCWYASSAAHRLITAPVWRGGKWLL